MEGTFEALKNPKPGMRFHEKGQFTVEVLAVEGGVIAVREDPPPLGPGLGYRFFRDETAFLKTYCYVFDRGERTELTPWVELLDQGAVPWEGSLLSLMIHAVGREACSAKELNGLLEKGPA